MRQTAFVDGYMWRYVHIQPRNAKLEFDLVAFVTQQPITKIVPRKHWIASEKLLAILRDVKAKVLQLDVDAGHYRLKSIVKKCGDIHRCPVHIE